MDQQQAVEAQVVAAEVPVAAPTSPGVGPTTEPVAKNGVIHLPSASLGRIKQEQRERGKKDAMLELQAKAKEAGFSSLEDMLAFTSELRKKQPAPGNGKQSSPQENDRAPVHQSAKPQPPANRHDRRAMERYERERAKWQQQTEALKRRAAQEERKRRELQREMDVRDARSSLEKVAIRKGVTEVDYALDLFQRELQKMTPEDIAKVDEEAFFEKLRSEKPFLFGEVVRPATTGTGVTGAQSIGPGTAAQQAAASGKVDAMKMKGDEFAALLRKRGFNPTL